MDVLTLDAAGDDAPARDAVKAYLAAVRAKVEAFAKTIDDSALPDPNEALVQAGLGWSIGQSLLAVSSHASYHLGHGDALLRSEGRPGIF
jgi:uncharacterized damage-inducible protein DinB